MIINYHLFIDDFHKNKKIIEKIEYLPSNLFFEIPTYIIDELYEKFYSKITI